MGITGLIPFLKKSTRTINLSEFKGSTAVVDAYCWLHKGAFSCADKLVKGEPTDGYVIYVMKQVNLLLSFDIKPILVFDGCHLPAKAVTETKRREKRDINQRKAKELLRQGKLQEARECFQRCVDVTSKMAHDVIEACRSRNIDTIVAPYEADAQLAFLNICDIADIVITEDSDLIVFGCKKILLKLDKNGNALLIEKDKIYLSMNIPPERFSFDKFQHMCIISGCDYLPSLPGIGLGKACKFITVTSNPDISKSLCRMPSHLKMPSLEVNIDYRKGFLRALNTFKHQLVFDPRDRCIKPLFAHPSDLRLDDLDYCGPLISHEKGLQIALGNINVQTGNLIDSFDPQNYKHPQPKSSSWASTSDLVTSHPSIWDLNYFPRSMIASKSKPGKVNLEEGPFSTFRKKKTIDVKITKKLVKEGNSSEDPAASDQLLSKLYSVPQTLPKQENGPEQFDYDNRQISIYERSENIEQMKNETKYNVSIFDEKEFDFALPNFELTFEKSNKDSCIESTDYNTLEKCKLLLGATVKDVDVSSSMSNEIESNFDEIKSPECTSPVFTSKRARNPFAKKDLSSHPGNQSDLNSLKNMSKKESLLKVKNLIHSRYFVSTPDLGDVNGQESTLLAEEEKSPSPSKSLKNDDENVDESEDIVPSEIDRFIDDVQKQNSILGCDSLNKCSLKRKRDDEQEQLMISPPSKSTMAPSFEWGHGHKRKSNGENSSLPITPPDSQILDEKENYQRSVKVKVSPSFSSMSVSKYFSQNDSSSVQLKQNTKNNFGNDKKSFCRQPGLTKSKKSIQPSLHCFGFKKC